MKRWDWQAHVSETMGDVRTVTSSLERASYHMDTEHLVKIIKDYTELGIYVERLKDLIRQSYDLED